MVGWSDRDHASRDVLARMPLPETINTTFAPDAMARAMCVTQDKWKLSRAFVEKTYQLAAMLPFQIALISGFRTERSQNELRARGRPTADNDKSTHLSCPATGGDFRIALTDNSAKLAFGTAATSIGFRWGGGSPIDPETGIPSDWNHLDLGPRQSA